MDGNGVESDKAKTIGRPRCGNDGALYTAIGCSAIQTRVGITEDYEQKHGWHPSTYWLKSEILQG